VEIITDVAALQARTLGWRAGGLRVGFVPTMASSTGGTPR
jgi:pantothenate synthetase